MTESDILVFDFERVSLSGNVRNGQTQKGRILAALTTAGNRGVCLLTDLDPEDSYAGRNRVGELRKEGYDIESAPCKVHKHRSTVHRYVLRGKP